MFTKRSQTILGITLVVVLALLGSWMLTNNVVPAGIQGQEDVPTLLSPDFTAFAETCCPDNGTPRILTPSKEQVDLWTAVAVTQTVKAQDAALATEAPLGQFLTPSDEWTTYKHPTLNYSFEYPLNWIIEQEPGSNTVYLYNISPGIPPKNELDPNRIKIIILHRDENINDYPSLESYVNDPKYAVPQDQLIEPQEFEILDNGYQLIRQKRMVFMSNGGVLVVYITNGKEIYTLTIFSLNSNYISVIDRVWTSFVISE